MWRCRWLPVALLLLALPLSAPISNWDILPDGRTLASTLDTPTSAPNISQWIGAIIDYPSDAGHRNAPGLLCAMQEEAMPRPSGRKEVDVNGHLVVAEARPLRCVRQLGGSHRGVFCVNSCVLLA